MRGRGNHSVLLVLVAALVLPACGSDEDESQGGDSTPTQAVESGSPPANDELISRADAICGQGKIAIDMARSQFHHGNFDQAAEGELEAFVSEQIVPVYRNVISSLGKLPDPSEDLGEVIAAAEKAVDELAADPLEINIRGGSSLFDEANRLAGDFGLSVCVAP